MPKINISLDADLVIEVMLLSGVRNAQDAVEVIVRDYIAHGNRTEAVTGEAADPRRTGELEPRGPAAE
jgi:Arc/MetJ family transcription regulator